MFARSICAVVACGFTLPAVAARVVYLAEQDYAFVSELYVGDLDRPGESVKLNKPLPWFAEGVGSFAVSPDGSKIVFSADRQTGEDTDLCLVDIAMPGALTRLGNLPSGWLEGFAKFSPDGGKIAFTASDEMFANTQLYLVDLATPGSATRMNGDLAIHGAVSQFGFEFTADGSHLVYVAGELEKKFELYAVALDKPGQSVRLNAPGGSVGDHLWRALQDPARQPACRVLGCLAASRPTGSTHRVTRCAGPAHDPERPIRPGRLPAGVRRQPGRAPRRLRRRRRNGKRKRSLPRGHGCSGNCAKDQHCGAVRCRAITVHRRRPIRRVCRGQREYRVKARPVHGARRREFCGTCTERAARCRCGRRHV